MRFLLNILQDILQRPSRWLFILLLIYTVDRYNRWADFNNGDHPLVYDVDQYYSYLPAAFIHNDLSFQFQHDYWTTKTPEGNFIPKVTMGMAIMYAPFFLTGHLAAKFTGQKTDGYSLPYRKSIHIGSILISLTGLWFMRKNLLRYFSELTVFICLGALLFGTNLFYYTYGYGAMPHAYLFLLFSLFIHFTFKWMEKKELRHFTLLSLIAGYAVLIRPTEVLILLFPFLIGIRSFPEIRERFHHLAVHRLRLLLPLSLFILPFFLQMIYWKVFTGHWIYFSYGEDEHFFFNDPKITGFLFSFRKGWFLYTPLMLLAVSGIFLLKKDAAELKPFLLIHLPLTVYILSSWWDWSFGGSFGCRAMVQNYTFLAFPLAAFIDFMFTAFRNRALNYLSRIIVCVSFLFLIDLNMDQSWLYKYGIISSDGMTRESYFLTFGKDSFTEEEVKEVQRFVKTPDRAAMKRGERD